MPRLPGQLALLATAVAVGLAAGAVLRLQRTAPPERPARGHRARVPTAQPTEGAGRAEAAGADDASVEDGAPESGLPGQPSPGAEGAGAAGGTLASAASGAALDPETVARKEESLRRLVAGRERLLAHDPRGALTDLVPASELDPGSAAAREQLGVAYLQLAEHDRARAAFLDALDRDPALADSQEGLGRIAYSEGRYDEAVERLLACLKVAPDRQSAKDLLERARRDAPLEAKFTEVYTSHFRLKVEGKLDPDSDGQALAQRVGDLLEAAHDAVGARLNLYPSAIVPVVLYADRQFYEVTGAHGWIGGLYDGKIRIPVKSAFQADTALLAKVCRHEYTHAVIYMTAPRCPRWLHEGIAREMEGTAPNTEWVAAHERKGLLPPVARLDEYFRGARTTEEASLVYEMAACFARYLFTRHGPTAVTDLIRALGEGQDMDDATRRALGASLDVIDGEWRQTLVR